MRARGLRVRVLAAALAMLVPETCAQTPPPPSSTPAPPPKVWVPIELRSMKDNGPAHYTARSSEVLASLCEVDFTTTIGRYTRGLAE